MILCDLCGESTECLQKEIDGREYDICADCSHLLTEKLKGKGRAEQNRETVFLPKTPKHRLPKFCNLRNLHNRSRLTHDQVLHSLRPILA